MKVWRTLTWTFTFLVGIFAIFSELSNFFYWAWPLPYLELFWAGPVKKYTLYIYISFYLRTGFWILWFRVIADIWHLQLFSKSYKKNHGYKLKTHIMGTNSYLGYKLTSISEWLGRSSLEVRGLEAGTDFSRPFPPVLLPLILNVFIYETQTRMILFMKTAACKLLQSKWYQVL